MKVGLLFSNPLAENGGAFTFQQDLFGSFLDLSDQSSHYFYVICEPWLADSYRSRAGSCQNVVIAPMPRARGAKLRSAANRLSRAVRLGESWKSREATTIAAHKIEFVFSLGHYAHDCFDTPFMTTVLDLQHWLQPWFPEVSRGREWQAREDYFYRYLSRAAFVVTGTEQGRQEIEAAYRVPRHRIRILPLATPRYFLDAAKRNVTDRLNALGVRPPYVLYPAQFWPHKNHANLLHGLKILRPDIADMLTLVLVGADFGNRSYVQSLTSELGIADRVKFLGFVEQADLVALYQGALALTFVTFFGPDNLPPLEAFALGCPVIASDVPGAREQLGDAALYVRATDPADIAKAIEGLYDSTELRETMAQRGLERAGRWTSKDYIAGVFSILDEFSHIRRCWK